MVDPIKCSQRNLNSAHTGPTYTRPTLHKAHFLRHNLSQNVSWYENLLIVHSVQFVM